MKMLALFDRNYMRHLKRAHQYRALLKRKERGAVRSQRENRNGKAVAK